MKFKAAFSVRGLKILEKGFIPTLEKFGKTCQVLLGPEDIHFIQTGINTDGVHITARIAQDILFHEDSYLIKSRCNDMIAFNFEVSNLLRVLRGAAVNGADLLELKLAVKTFPMSGNSGSSSLPFLTFTSRGESVSIVNDMPISQPYKADEIEQLVQGLDSETLCPFYVDIQPEVPRLQSVLDKMKGLGDSVLLAVSKVAQLRGTARARALAASLHSPAGQRDVSGGPRPPIDGLGNRRPYELLSCPAPPARLGDRFPPFLPRRPPSHVVLLPAHGPLPPSEPSRHREECPIPAAQGGDLHIQVQHEQAELGVELRGLAVLPADQASRGWRPSGASADERLREILSAEEGAASVEVQLKHVAKSLQVSQLTQPHQLLCGFAENNGHVHLMFVYRDPFSNAAYDDRVSLSYKLPVRSEW
uniref:Checkpoint protein n=1 Tax=Tetraselmis sp. GSL018 TaxID=582737 RepID=A0A061R1S6_9CHLO|mmetsp:Transcript_20250/g.48225  ORF Transcript_20250/g.48225 Transcript_20250/m.48225 type:complete len:418 (+) Transcript_20250:69-1322(+)|eukprot:CAMPEP_0177607940 /NCGR_PEP_ID=MMETSP0419_2-20121207/18193_1 /TAXON_ID=582737 /ORGANISM="Tetraselmis sp., Strain GSL018" /LENGTH=417 /DNA_ID=CAMNT_0019102571 /DNA_START=278 /DNA_END=1531 /DNA_ORIENTATION=+